MNWIGTFVNHSCDNHTCELLNPSLTELLGYEDLLNRISEADKNHFDLMRTLGLRPIEKWIELLGKNISFFEWCDYHNVYQIVTKEFIKALADVIEGINPEVIVEVGAGRGVMGKYLSEVLNMEIILTDNHSYWMNEQLPDAIKIMDYKKAIETYNPDLVIASWIPHGRYWTWFFRKYPSVKGYILIGESPGGATGSVKDFYKNGCERTLLDEVKRYSICRYDHFFLPGHPMRHSYITYFKKPNGRD